MTPVARQALVIACCCFAGFLVTMAVDLILALSTMAHGDMSDAGLVLGLYLFAMWLGLSALMLTVYNWEEWWR